MANLPYSDRQRTALRAISAEGAARAILEEDTASGGQARQAAADTEFQEAQRRVQGLYEAARQATERQLQDARQCIAEQASHDLQEATQDHATAQHKANYQYTTAKEKIESDFKESRWTITTIYDADKKVAREQRAQAESRAEAAVNKVLHSHQEAEKLLAVWRLLDLTPTLAPTSFDNEPDPARAMQECVVLASTKLLELKSLRLPRYLNRFGWLWGLAWVLFTVPALFIDPPFFWALGSALVVGSMGWLVRQWMKQQVRTQAGYILQTISQALSDVHKLKPRALAIAKAHYKSQRAESKRRNQETLRQAVRTCRQQLRDITAQREMQIQQAQQQFAVRRDEITRRQRNDIDQAESTFQRQWTDIHSIRDSELAQVTLRFERLRKENNTRHAQEWTHMASTWKSALDRFQAVLWEIDQPCRKLFPPWDDPWWAAWQPPTAVPLGIRFGELGVSLDLIPNGVPRDPRLPKPSLDGVTFPALLPFPNKASLLYRTRDEGRAQAVASLQALVLRFLTALPPGKVRFTIIDPVGRGENFAALMHLADFDEQLVSSRIWTESAHIDQRLADLTEHMENVIQKYLRNEYETLEEYNAAAGEVAEPYRILVVANFPVNFSGESARRLVSLATSGARCGIYTLVSVDERQPLPQGFELADLEQPGLALAWNGQGFTWNDADFTPFPLRLDAPPPAEFSTRILQVIGERAKLAGRVEVPFEYVAPAPDRVWTADSRKGLAVPIGRAGATKQQFFQLGQGTAQHALVGGKTGSGKSTFLHTVITQLGLFYSPDEVELYLIDFKKGVEFKAYANHEMPHARVVAIESEREFGLSVLQRLDAELTFRGEEFRQTGVNDLPSYRQSHDADGVAPVMPRILLIVDEFQEFFVEDDKIAQEAARYLDRLVRQGRAFGIHVLLGSQTLGGAYSLARSTIDQMAVRIALQCSEADAHLILSKDNSAARLLSRPGEAIYNEAGGLLEGNNLFQIVWLADERRDRALADMAGLARQHGLALPPQIVFEGTAPSDITRNPLLEKAWQEFPPSACPAAFSAWLGEAIAIKDPTAAVFRRQSGCNLLMVGQQADAGFCMMASSLLSLAAQLPLTVNVPACHLIVGSPLDSAEEELLRHLPQVMGRALSVCPVRDLPGLLGQLAEEVERRQKTPASGDPVFLFLFGLQRLRDLRRADDDFGFSRKGETATPPKLIASILRDGPPVGVFTTLWCDNLNNLNRALDRQTLREFEMRVLGQMSAADSSNLIDSPLAGKLGPHRALFYSEDQGRIEKFRPYGIPPAAWLQRLKSTLDAHQAATTNGVPADLTNEPSLAEPRS